MALDAARPAPRPALTVAQQGKGLTRNRRIRCSIDRLITGQRGRCTMRVRPFFWFLLFFSCVGILVFAATNQTHAPARLQVHVDQQHLTSRQLTTLELDLTDPQGIPIEDAQVLSRPYDQHGYVSLCQTYCSAGAWKIPCPISPCHVRSLGHHHPGPRQWLHASPANPFFRDSVMHM